MDRGEADDTARLTAERDRLQREMSNLIDLVASGVSADTLAPKIREREAAIAKLDRQLRTPRQVPPNIEKLRSALLQRAEEWRAELRGEPQLARLLLRRLVGPITLTDPSDTKAFVEWAASLTPALLEGLAPCTSVGVPTGIRTRVSALKGPRPRPLDDGDSRAQFFTIASPRARSPCQRVHCFSIPCASETRYEITAPIPRSSTPLSIVKRRPRSLEPRSRKE